MASTAVLTQEQFMRIRTEVGFAIRGTTPHLARDPLEADEKEFAENIMEAGFVDVAKVLNQTVGDGELPLLHSVIKVPVPNQEMTNTYFVEGCRSVSGVSEVDCRLIKSDYARDEDFGLWLQLSLSDIDGWRYVYPREVSA